LNMLWILWCRL